MYVLIIININFITSRVKKQMKKTVKTYYVEIRVVLVIPKSHYDVKQV